MKCVNYLLGFKHITVNRCVRRNLSKPRLCAVFVLALVVVIYLAHSFRLLFPEKECRRLASVKYSATDLITNEQTGGKLWQNIRDIPVEFLPDIGRDTQLLYDLFLNMNEFLRAWTSWSVGSIYIPYPALCDDHTVDVAFDCVPAETIEVLASYKCFGVDRITGLCIESRRFRPERVSFKYIRNSNRDWILFAAYPMERDNCVF